MSLTWPSVPAAGKADNFAKKGWTLLPNGELLTIDVGTPPHAEHYDPIAAQWYSDGNTPIGLTSPTSAPGGADSAAPAWAPTITAGPATVTRGFSYMISGTQFNGLSQAAAVGDELNAATNYPLVRITNMTSGHLVYARTHGHSTMGVATGNLIVSTHFDVPAGAEAGASSLIVVANGIASAPVSVTVN